MTTIPPRANPGHRVGPVNPGSRVTWPTGDPQAVVLAGDWHGDLHIADAVLRSARDTGADLVIQLGDFGMWTGPPGARFLDHVDARAAAAGVLVAWLDGNHEDHDFLEDFPIDPATGLRPVRENVWHVPR
ncbi:MAG: metallophosphoesterase family protein, partial [Actinomycetes bacterium]